MFRTLRAKLLVWYSIVLMTVLASFATATIWSIWSSSVRELDARLDSTASRLARALVRDADGRYEVNIAADDFAGFRAASDAPYYAIWTRNGALVDRSDSDVDVAFPGRPQVRTRDDYREVVVQGDNDVVVLVGQSLAQARSERATAIFAFTVAGGIAILVASLGAWFLVGRALAPIGRIAETAEAMSHSNLGLRIDVSRTEDELGSVATALNRAFDRLQEAFERHTRFTADASHELRTPLASQIAEVEWALAKPRSEVEYESSLAVCLRAAQRMRGVVEGLLTLARADADAIVLRREPVDLARLAEEVASTFRRPATARTIELHIEGGPAFILGDVDRLRDLVTNLLSNAVQHTPQGGTVSCLVSAAEEKTTLEVRDTGSGIDSDDLPHVFERFYRANKARSRLPGGAGLGLAISKWIVESHGGQIRCESPRGRGTSFTVEFPADRKGVGISGRLTPVPEIEDGVA
jgi:heavy metal sensor kinase